MNEAGFKRKIKKNCTELIIRNIESPTTMSGLSDCTYSGRNIRGWYEAKLLKSFPKRPTTPVRIPHFTNEQRAFIYIEGRQAGYSFLVVQVAKDVFIFDHHKQKKVGFMTKEDMIKNAHRYYKGKVDWKDFTDALCERVK